MSLKDSKLINKLIKELAKEDDSKIAKEKLNQIFHIKDKELRNSAILQVAITPAKLWKIQVEATEALDITQKGVIDTLVKAIKTEENKIVSKAFFKQLVKNYKMQKAS